MTVLYRKYRPKTFAEVAGQEHVKTALANEVATERIAHSYVFSGPRGVGKTSLARIFAKALNCRERSKAGEPCGSCDACVEIAEGRALDVVEIDAASHTGVDNVREQVIENARFAPSKLAYKVFIIDEVHMLSTSAFNALLKTLEEPPARVVFILATTELHKLPATVVSRCQRFDFRKIPSAELVERLNGLAAKEGVTVEEDVLSAVARLSEGCLRDAESLLSQIFSLGEKKITAETAALVLPIVSSEAVNDLMSALVARDASKTLASWEALLAAGADPIRIVSELVERGREAALASMKDAGNGLAARSSLLERLVRAHGEMKRLDPPELGFELLLAEWCAEPARAKEEPPRHEPPAPPTAPASKPEPTAAASPEAAPAPMQAERVEAVSPENSEAFAQVKEKWTEILMAAQKRNHGLPYMLGAAELLNCDGGLLTVGFQYAMYRDRLNDKRHRESFEAALGEVLGSAMRVKAVLVAQRTDGLVEPSPHIQVEASANLPDGFADLVKEFGGTVAAG
ncbi:MAG: DNA polymerase III subunit gamma/tau [Patescibacteria group bacterium]|nr:MAG: DNA polymerase III subunit gamma/tau [Patescibacteria group bacterium]